MIIPTIIAATPMIMSITKICTSLCYVKYF